MSGEWGGRSDNAPGLRPGGFSATARFGRSLIRPRRRSRISLGQQRLQSPRVSPRTSVTLGFWRPYSCGVYWNTSLRSLPTTHHAGWTMPHGRGSEKDMKKKKRYESLRYKGHHQRKLVHPAPYTGGVQGDLYAHPWLHQSAACGCAALGSWRICSCRMKLSDMS